MEAASDAVSQMIDLLAARYGMAPVDAYMLVSVCGDLRISEIVDHAELGRVLLLPAVRVRMTSAARAHAGRGLPRPSADRTVLALSGLTVSVQAEEGERAVVSELSFDLRRGETLCIAGESGSGKSMTALAIMGFCRSPQRAFRPARSGSPASISRRLAKAGMRRIRGDRRRDDLPGADDLAQPGPVDRPAGRSRRSSPYARVSRGSAPSAPSRR